MGTIAPIYKEYLSAKDWHLSLLVGGGTFLIRIGSGKGREQLWSMQYGPLQFSSIELELENFISSKLRLLPFSSHDHFGFWETKLRAEDACLGTSQKRFFISSFLNWLLGSQRSWKGYSQVCWRPCWCPRQSPTLGEQSCTPISGSDG